MTERERDDGRGLLVAGLLVLLLCGVGVVALAPDDASDRASHSTPPALPSDVTPDEDPAETDSAQPADPNAEEPAPPPSAGGGVLQLDPEDLPAEPPRPEPSRVRIKVVNVDGEPVPGAEVHLDNNPLGGDWATTGPNGEATLELGQAVYNVMVAQDLPDGTQITGRSAVRAYWGTESTHTVVLDRTAMVTVELAEPVRRWGLVLVAQRPTPSPFPGLFSDDERRIVRAGSNPFGTEADDPTRVLSAGERIEPGDYDLIVYGLDGPITSAETSVRVTSKDQRVALTLKPQGSLSVRVRDPDGRPTAARLQVQPLEERHTRLLASYEFPFVQRGVNRPPALVVSGLAQDGALHVPDSGFVELPSGLLPPGRWKVVAIPEDPDLARATTAVRVESGARVEAGLSLRRGRVVDVRCDRPLSEVGEFLALGPEGIRLRQRDADTLQVTGLLPGDTATILASRDAFSVGPPLVGRVDIAGADLQATLHVGAPAEVLGTVLNPDGHPLGSAGVDLRYVAEPLLGPDGYNLTVSEYEDEPPEGEPLEDMVAPPAGFLGAELWQTDADGTFSGIQLPPGRYRFWLPGGEPQTVQVGLGEQRRLVFDLPR